LTTRPKRGPASGRRVTPLGPEGLNFEAFGLTPRELEIISAIVAGYTNKDIAEKLSLSQETVKHHLSHIFDKAGVSNRLELAIWSIRHGFV